MQLRRRGGEVASTSVQTVDVAAPTAATTKYYGCKVSDHCTDGQKIAISWTDADGCLSDEEFKCDSNCDGSCDQCNESCDDNCNSGCDKDSEGNYCDEHYDYDCRYGCNEDCTTGCDDNCNDNCDGSCDGSCSCKDADAASTRAAASGAVLLAPSPRCSKCCSARLYIPNLRRRTRPPLPPFPSPLLDRRPLSAPASGSSPLLDRLSKSQLLTSQTPRRAPTSSFTATAIAAQSGPAGTAGPRRRLHEARRCAAARDLGRSRGRVEPAGSS